MRACARVTCTLPFHGESFSHWRACARVVGMIDRVGSSKIRSLREAGIRTVEGLASIIVTTEFAIRVSGRSGLGRNDRSEAVKTVTGWKDAAIRLLKERRRWPILRSAPPAAPSSAAPQASPHSAPQPSAAAPSSDISR